MVPIVLGTMIIGRADRAAGRAGAFETDRQLIVGDVTLPPAGYQSRFSDSLNRGDLEFVPLTNVEITSLADGKVERAAFVVALQAPHPARLPGRPARRAAAARRG